MIALMTKEIYRFYSIWIQTILGPLVTALLYQLVFGHQLANVHTGISGVTYNTFLIPGLVIMQVLINSFANSSSSLIQSKYTGNIVFILMAPISDLEMYIAYLFGSMIRGLLVGVVIYCGIVWFGDFRIHNVFIIILFGALGASLTGAMGIIAGAVCRKFDQLAGFQSFIFTPCVYLSGVFFSVSNFSNFWRTIAQIDPLIYIVDGFKYGFFGVSQFAIYWDLLFLLFATLAINILGFVILAKQKMKFV
jgi:ABC-2 type transport system permease protein